MGTPLGSQDWLKDGRIDEQYGHAGVKPQKERNQRWESALGLGNRWYLKLIIYWMVIYRLMINK